MTSSGWRTYGTMRSSGWRVHALTPASASDAPISFRNSRRPAGSLNSDAWSGNSRPTYSRNSEVSASSSRLRQYVRPSSPASRDRMSASVINYSGLAVAHRAAGHVLGARDVVFLLQLEAQ